MLEGLNALQAAWKPQPQRFSIWENALHLIVWREVMARRARGEQASAEERKRRNHESPNYHFGQIMYLGAMQGLPPIV